MHVVDLFSRQVVGWAMAGHTGASPCAHGRPDGIRGNIVLHEIPVYGIMRENRLVLGHIGLSVVDECRKDELKIVPTCWF